jgi:hypothetical protein
MGFAVSEASWLKILADGKERVKGYLLKEGHDPPGIALTASGHGFLFPSAIPGITHA